MLARALSSHLAREREGARWMRRRRGAVHIRFAVALALLAAPIVASAQPVPAEVEWPRTRWRDAVPTISLLGPPLLEVGSAAGPDHSLLSGVVGAVRLSDGGVAVADGSTQRILFFDQRGAFRRAIGRLGDGPGEFRFLRWMGRCGSGNLGAYNGAPPRLTVFSETGEFSRQVTLPTSLGFHAPIACSHPDSISFLIQTPTTPLSPGRSGTFPAVIVRVASGHRQDTVATGLGQVYYFSARMPGAFADVPLRPATLAAFGRTHLFVVESGQDTVHVFDASGTRRSTFHLGLRSISMTPAHWRRGVQDRRAREPLVRTRHIVDTVLAEVGPVREMPLIADIVADSENRLWVKTFDNYLTPYATWLIVSADGRLIARAVTSATLRPLEIGGDYLLGIIRDADDVESVVLLRHTLGRSR